MRMRKANTANLSDDLNRLLNDLRDVLASKTHDADATASQLYSKAVATLEKARSASSAALDESKAAVQSVDTYVHDSPWRAVGGALAVGVLLGFFWCGRNAR